jgi:hypothetical protein
MLKKITLSSLILIGVLILHAQYPDNKWLLGYSSTTEPNNGFGLVQLEFTNSQLTIGEEIDITEPVYLGRNISLISASTGDSILFYFNGLQVNDGAHELAMNGGEMYYGELSLGYDIRNGSLILPVPEANNEYLLVSAYVIQDEESWEIYAPELNVSTISTEGGVEVIVKNETVVSGVFPTGQLTATRHANGRDWWIIWPYKNTNRYLRFILTPTGLERLEDQIIGQNLVSGAGAACFSPDGRFYAAHNSISGAVGNFF